MINRRDALKVIGSTAGALTVARLLPGCTEDEASLGEDESDLLSAAPPTLEKMSSDATWGTGWTHIVPGRWSSSVYTSLLFYNKAAGTAAFYEVTPSNMRAATPFKQYANWRTTWSHVVSGYWSESPYSGVLLYDPTIGQIEIYDTNGAGTMTLIAQKSVGLGWTHVVPGWHYAASVDLDHPNQRQSVLLYNQTTGTAQWWGFATNLGVLDFGLLYPHAGWRTTWTHVLAGNFGYEPYGHSDILFYEGTTGHAEIWTWSIDANGFRSFEVAVTGSTVVGAAAVVGNFGSGSGTCDVAFLGGPTAGQLQFYNRDLTCFESALPGASGMRTTAGVLVPGKFVMPDPDDHWLQEGPVLDTPNQFPGDLELRKSQLREWRASPGAFTDLFAYDQPAGIGECFFHGPKQPTVPDVDGYLTSQSWHGALQGFKSSGSILASEQLDLHLSVAPGFTNFDVFVVSAETSPATVIPLGSFASGTQYFYGRAAYRFGPQWPVFMTIPTTGLASGFYFVQIRRAGTRCLEIPFVVRSQAPGVDAKVLVVVPDVTYQAYNAWGGRSSYGLAVDNQAPVFGSPPYGFLPYAMVSSFARPFKGMYAALDRRLGDEPPSPPPVRSSWAFRIVAFIDWLKLQGIKADFCTGRDLDLEVPSSNYKLLVFPGHHEYWSHQMRLNTFTFRSGGGNVAVFSGNTCWIQVRFDYANDQMICYRWRDFDPQYRSGSPILTSAHFHISPVNWSSAGSPSNPLDYTNSLTGTIWSTQLIGEPRSFQIYQPDPSRPPPPPNPMPALDADPTKHWSFAAAVPLMTDPVLCGATAPCFGRFSGNTQSVVGGTFGTDSETDQTIGDSPAMYYSLAAVKRVFEDCDPTHWKPDCASAGIFSPNGNNAVFNAATTNWTLGLARTSSTWNAMDQITLNVLSGLGVPQTMVPPGSDVGANEAGAVWIVGTDAMTGGFGIYTFNGTSWVNGAPFGATRIAVASTGDPWICDASFAIKRRNGGSWTTLPGAGRDIAIGTTGETWLIGTNAVGGSYGIFRWTGSSWAAVDGGGTRITVDKTGAPWVCNHLGDVYVRPGGFSGTWQWLSHPPGTTVTDLAAASDGTVWVCGTTADGRNAIHRYINGRWARVPGTASWLAASTNKLWISPPRLAIPSSTYGFYAASNVLDGRSDTRWSSAFTDNEWIVIDLGAISYIKRITLSWEAAYATKYTLEVSGVSSNPFHTSWHQIANVTNGDGGVDVFDFPSGTQGRYVIMRGIQRANSFFGYSLWSFDIECFPQ